MTDFPLEPTEAPPSWHNQELATETNRPVSRIANHALATPKSDEGGSGTPLAKRPQSKISSSTPIVPSAIAIAVWEEACIFLNAKLPRSWMIELTRRAEIIFRHHKTSRSRIRTSGNSGRDYLWTFMRHWLAGLIIEHDPVLADRLPASYRIGKAPTHHL